MFFCDYQSPSLGARELHIERLAIFGDDWGRVGAELKIMAAIEAKRPGHFTKGLEDQMSPEEGWAIDTMPLTGAAFGV